MVQPGLDRADRHADDVGDVGELEPGVVVQNEDGSVLRRQTSERTIERVPVVDREHGIDAARSVEGERRDVA